MKYRNIKLRKGSQSGFTLIELLMVVVILGILAYVSMSAFSGSPNAANATAIRSGATEIAKGIGYIHANIGNGIKTEENPLAGAGATMLDVLMVGVDAVNNKGGVGDKGYVSRFEALEMRPMESEFRVITRGSRDNEGEYTLLSYPVSVTDTCPSRKVCIVFDNVPEAVRDEVITRYGLEVDTKGVDDTTVNQPLPVAFSTGSESATYKVKFALIP